MRQKLPKSDKRSVRDIALGLLARREHSQLELRQKLVSRECDADEIDEMLTLLVAEGLQSDQRFTESYIYSRKSRGYGPVRILAELRQRGIDDDISHEFLDSASEEWLEIARSQHIKKFGRLVPADYQARIKSSRYLQNRGFSSEIIHSILNSM